MDLLEAKKKLDEDVANGGGVCPCCNRFLKVYVRKLYATPIRRLAVAYNRFGFEPFHILKDFDNKHPGDFGKLRFWGLVEELPHDGSSMKRTSGMWKVTGLGASFIIGNVKVRRSIMLESGEFLAFHGDLVTVHDIMGEEFNYREMMSL